LKKCNLPLTGEKVVDLVVTDLAVFTIDKHGKDGMALIELADGVTLDEVKSKTESRIPGGAEEPRNGRRPSELLEIFDQRPAVVIVKVFAEIVPGVAVAGFGSRTHHKLAVLER